MDKIRWGNMAPLAFLLAGGAVFYYYVLFLPKQEQGRLELQKQEQEVAAKIRCSDMAAKWRNENEQNTIGTTFFNPQYVFNEKLNTCLYEGGWRVKEGMEEHYIVDLSTNKRLAQYIFYGDETFEQRGKQLTEYDAAKKEFFGD